MKVKRIGLYGGTFDPVHVGHVKAALFFRDEMRLDRLFVFPNSIPPMKLTSFSNSEDRLEMLRIAFDGEEKIEIDDHEIKRGGVSFSYLTLEHYKTLFPQDQFFFLIGDDSLETLGEWKNVNYLYKNCTFCVYPRTGVNYTERIKLLSGKGARIVLLSGEITAASSTKIRKGEEDNVLPSGVREYILQKGLYI